ncbi:VWA domain-containing protein [Candidatus Latescibacterota bacterium]
MLEKLFEFLFKYRIINYEEGSIVFQSEGNAYLFIGLLLLLIGIVAAIYYTAVIYTNRKSRLISSGLRILAILLLCLPFFEPSLMFPDIVPNENFLAVLVDNSESMSIPDGTFGETRADDASAILVGENNGILPELEQNFNVRYYTFSNEASRVDSVANLIPNGRETNLDTALRRVMNDFTGLPLSGIVLLTDGGDNSSDNVRNTAEELRGLGIPLHIVGLGNEELSQEREILSVATNLVQSEGMGAEIELKVKSWVDEKEPVTVSMYKEDRLVMSRNINLRGNGNVDYESFYYWPKEHEVAQYTLQIAPASNEVNVENNVVDLLIDSSTDSVKVLYLEGYLRTDFKFIKRALESDQVLEFASVSRTGTGKYYRQGISSSEELKGGFPTSEEELFGYKAIILGDIEANYFSMTQLEMIERFVSSRGGGFLMMGGRNSFAEGEYWNTPIADLLPVKLDPSRKTVLPPDFSNQRLPREEQGFQFVPTRAGLENPILKLSEDIQTNRLLWSEVPNFFSINYLGDVKPGAVVLAEKPDDDFGPSEPLLITHRYGKGRSAALATASTWRWKMLLDESDTRHERFWRQFVRWLSTDTPDKVNIELTDNRFEPGTELPIRVSVYDDVFKPMSYADVAGTVTGPNGKRHEVQFFPDLNGEGEYIGTVFIENPGIYTIDVVAKQDSMLIGTQKQSVLSYLSKKEFHNSELQKSFLENIATLNNGNYYELSETDDIPTNLTGRQTSTSIFHYKYIWDSPILFILIIMILSLEWVYRRNRGLP